MDEWIDYYDSTHTIYASRLHRDLHFQVIANDIIGYITSPDAVVLAVPDPRPPVGDEAERFAARAGNIYARALAPKVLPGSVSAATQTALANCESPAQAVALLLVAPEFMRR